MLDILNHLGIPHSCLIPNIKNWSKYLGSIFYITEVTCFSETVLKKTLLGNLHLWVLEKRESRDKKARWMIRLAKNLTEKQSETETHRKKENIISGLWREWPTGTVWFGMIFGWKYVLMQAQTFV